MARIGRTHASRSVLRRPVSINAAADPAQRDQTVRVTLAGRTVAEYRRHFPLQGWNGDNVKGEGPNLTSSAGVFERTLGPEPPTVVRPLPTQQMQTITACSVARRTRLEPRYIPKSQLADPSAVEPKLYLPDRRLLVQVDVVAVARAIESAKRQPHAKLLPTPLLAQPPPPTAAVAATDVAARTGVERVRHAGSWRLAPPTAVLPLPTLAMQTITVTLASWQPVLERTRRAPHFDLAPPAVVEPYLLVPDRRLVVDTALQAVARRLLASQLQPHFRLLRPQVLFLPPPLTVALVATRTRTELQRRAPHYYPALAAPAVVEPYLRAPDRRLTVQVDSQAIPTRVGIAQRAPHSRLAAPGTLEPESIELKEQTVTVALAGRTRTETQRRAPHYLLQPPAVVDGRLTAPDRRLAIATTAVAVRTAVEQTRHAPHSRLLPPGTLEPEVVKLRERTIQVVLSWRTRVELVRRAPDYRLAAPVVVEPALLTPDRRLTIPTALVRIRPVPTRALHIVPATLEPEAVELRERSIVVVLGGRIRTDAVRRSPLYRLAPPAAVEPALHPPDRRLTIVTALARIRPVPTRTLRVTPGTLEPEVVELREQTIAVTLAVRPRTELQRRRPIARLGAPTAVVPLPTQQAETVAITCVAVRSRTELERRYPTHSRLRPPVFYPVTSAIGVALAGRTRIETQRLRTHYLIAAPATLAVFAGPPPSLAKHTRTDLLRHAPHWKITPPVAVLPLPSQQAQTVTVTLAGRTRAEVGRRSPRSALAAPATLIAAPAVFYGPAVTLSTRTRVELARRAPHARLLPPTVVVPPPTLRAQTVRVTITRIRPPATRARLAAPIFYPATSVIRVALSGRTRVETQRRASHYRIAVPVTLLTFAGPTVALADVRARLEGIRRAPHSRLPAPAVVTPAPAQRDQTIKISSVAVRTRVEQTRHPGRVTPIRTGLSVPLGVVRTIYAAAVRAFTELRRRAPHSRLQPPTVVAPRVEPAVTKIAVSYRVAVATRVASIRRGPHPHLSPPAIVVPFSIVSWRLSPDGNWLFQAVPGNEWRTIAEGGWTASPEPAGWDAEPIGGWTMEPDLP